MSFSELVAKIPAIDPKITAVAQLIAYSMLTICSVAVAVVATWIGYRNAFGSKPVILPMLTSWSVHSEGVYILEQRFRFWNRRKHSVLVRSVGMHLGGLNVRNDIHLDDGWVVGTRGIGRPENREVAAGNTDEFTLRVAISCSDPQSLREATTIRVQYFDPFRAKELSTASTVVVEPRNWVSIDDDE